MKSVKLMEPQSVAVIHETKAEREPGTALLRLLYGGICGSDLGTYRGNLPYVSYPRVPGHEFSAEVMEVEDNTYGIKPGMIVTANPYFNCGKCYSCRRGLVNCCSSNETMGVQREGGFSEYITMPIERIYDGRGMDPRILALVEPFCISYHGVKGAGIKPGQKVLVVGAGTIGLLAAVSAKMRGASVYLCDVVMDKLEFAKGFGIDGVIHNTGTEEFDRQVKEIVGEDGFDITVEAVGLPQTLQNCFDAVCFGGMVVVIGVGKKNLDFDFTVIQKKELRILGSRNAVKEDFEEVIDLLMEGQVNVEPVISAIFPAEEAAQAFAYFDQTPSSVKVLLKFD